MLMIPKVFSNLNGSMKSRCRLWIVSNRPLLSLLSNQEVDDQEESLTILGRNSNFIFRVCMLLWCSAKTFRIRSALVWQSLRSMLKWSVGVAQCYCSCTADVLRAGTVSVMVGGVFLETLAATKDSYNRTVCIITKCLTTQGCWRQDACQELVLTCAHCWPVLTVGCRCQNVC